jgi:bifunctional non-homologous end joining protein LigD
MARRLSPTIHGWRKAGADSTLAASALHSTRCLARELRRRLQSDRPSCRFEPYLPRPVQHPPAGPGWIHEIKHDGFRILAHRRGRSIRLVTRNGYDFADRFPLVTAAIEELPVKSCIIDGEAIVCDDSGLAVFDLIRGHATNAGAVLCAFDLLEVNGEDIRREPIEDRKRRLAGLLRRPQDGIAVYQVVRVEAGPETSDGEIACRVCGSPLAARDGEFVLKYFLLRAARRLGRNVKPVL